MRSPGTNGEGELRGQLANPGSPGKMAVKTECVCECVLMARCRLSVESTIKHQPTNLATFLMVITYAKYKLL